MTVRGMPADASVSVLMAETIPFTDNAASILWPPLQTSGDGVARSAPFRPPWRCEQQALSLFTFAEQQGQLPTRGAELLYRIALGENELPPGLKEWLNRASR